MGVLLVWWIVAPTVFDDSWQWVVLRLFGDLGSLGSYFDNWGVDSPTGHWLEWLRHWTVRATNDDLVFMRLPSLLAILASWPLSRWCFRHVVPGGTIRWVRWTLAGAFLVNVTAWSMTLRTEPFVSLLTLVGFAAMVSFVRVPRLAPLAVAVPAVVFAATAHPAGLVAASPMLAATPEMIRWLRSGVRRLPLAFGALALAGLTLALVVFTLDADLQTRIGDARLLREGEFHNEPWWREYIRYTQFDEFGGATAARRLSLALLLLSVAAWLTRSRHARTGVLTLPARSVAVALVLLAFTPSKWPWHFGALAAVGAVATAAEVARLIRVRTQPGRVPVRSICALVVVGAAALWSWRAPGSWSSLDLQKARWNDGFGVKGYGWMVVALILAAVLTIRKRRRLRAGQRLDRLPAIVGWAVPVVSFAVVVVTVTILLIDAAISPWSPTRQNLEALAGGGSCGLAHQLHGNGDVVDLLEAPESPTLLVPPVGVYFPCTTIPSIVGGVVEIPRLIVFESSPWPLYGRDGPLAAISDLYQLEGIARGPRGVEVHSVVDDVPGYVRVDVVRRDIREP